MKEKPELSIETAKEIALKHNKAIVIVLTIEESGRLTMHSYGKDKPACAAGGKLGEACFGLIMQKFKQANTVAESLADPKTRIFTPRIIRPNDSN